MKIYNNIEIIAIKCETQDELSNVTKCESIENMNNKLVLVLSNTSKQNKIVDYAYFDELGKKYDANLLVRYPLSNLLTTVNTNDKQYTRDDLFVVNGQIKLGTTKDEFKTVYEGEVLNDAVEVTNKIVGATKGINKFTGVTNIKSSYTTINSAKDITK